jgi:hypothetical protein
MPDKFNIDPEKLRQRLFSGPLVKIVLILGLLPFFGFAIFMIRQILHIMNNTKNPKMAIPFILLVLFILAVPVMGTISVLRKLKKYPPGASPPPRAEKPWLARADWAEGKIKSSAGADMRALFFMGLIFTAVGACYTFFVIPEELHQGNYLTLLILFFPAAGIFLLVAAVLQRRGQRRFGDTLFVMASVPGVPGSALQGSIQTSAAIRPQQGLHLRLSCIRRVRTGGRNPRNSENILWQDDKILKNEAVAMQSGHTAIPVYFQVPAGQPECFAHGNEAIIWRLDASAKMSGPDFKAAFDLPVFNLAAAVARPVAAADPTAALQMPVEEIRRDEHSKILVGNAPGGREFFFPAARNPGTAFGLTLVTLIFSAAVWFMIKMKAPLLFPIVFGFFAVVLFYSCVNLWFRRTCVTINSSRVSVARHWLIFGGTRSFDASEVARFDSKVGMTSGQQALYSIQLFTRTDKKITVGDLIPNKPETDWLVQEMNKAAGRSR